MSFQLWLNDEAPANFLNFLINVLLKINHILNRNSQFTLQFDHKCGAFGVVLFPPLVFDDAYLVGLSDGINFTPGKTP